MLAMAFARGGPMRLGGVHFWLSPPNPNSESDQMAPEQLRTEVFSHNVRRILRAGDLVQCDGLSLRLALDSQISHIQAPKLAQASAAYDANGSTGVRVDCNFYCDAKVCEESHHPQALAGPLGERV